MNIYLIIIGILLVIIGYRGNCFTNVSRSNFTPVGTFPVPLHNNKPSSVGPFGVVPQPTQERDTHYSDSRYRYPYNPPVNPMVVNGTSIRKFIPASPELYFTQAYDPHNTLIDSPPVESSNELYYSGGLNELIEIPLQYNVPAEPEQLRSQNILITPYNRVKYSNEPFRNTPY